MEKLVTINLSENKPSWLFYKVVKFRFGFDGLTTTMLAS